MFTWTAPGENGFFGQAEAYEIRLATAPPGTDPTAWWNGASVLPNPPTPAPGGSLESLLLSGLTPGVVTYVAVRTRNVFGAWSAISPIVAAAPSGDPLIQSVAPTDVLDGARTITLRGLGLDAVTQVRFHLPTGGSPVVATSVVPQGDGSLVVDADFPPAADGLVEVEVVTPFGSDRVSGWLQVSPDPAAGPVPVADFAMTVLDATSGSVRWTAPGTVFGEPVAAYEIRRLGGGVGAWDWDTGVVLGGPTPSTPGTEETWTVAGLVPGHLQALAIKSRDAAGAWSAVSNIATVVMPPLPGPPSQVTNLAATVLAPDRVALEWSAPSDVSGIEITAATAYDVRRLAGGPGAWTWDGGTILPSSPPLAPGALEHLEVGGLPPGTPVAFALKSVDGEGGWSELSNTVEILLPVPADTSAPAGITDFAAGLETDGTVRLHWSTPGDDVAVTAFEVRRGIGSAADFLWETAEVLADPPAPGAPGTPIAFDAGILAPGDTVAFAAVARDAAGNRSPVSPVVTVGRGIGDLEAPDLPGSLEASRLGPGTVQIRWRAGGDDGLVGRAAGYEVRYRPNPSVGAPWWEDLSGNILPLTPKAPFKREFTSIGGLNTDVVYGFALRSFDDAGRTSAWLTAYLHVDGPTGGGPDASPPTAPTGLSASAGPQGIRLTWLPAPEPNIVGYEILRVCPDAAPVLLETVPPDRTSYTDVAPATGAARYTVGSVNSAGVRSVLSAWVEVQAAAAPGLAVTPQGTGWELTVPEGPLPGAASPTARVFDIRGRLVAEVSLVPAGDGWSGQWSGRSRSGRRLASGIFFVRVRTADRSISRKVLLTR